MSGDSKRKCIVLGFTSFCLLVIAGFFAGRSHSFDWLKVEYRTASGPHPQHSRVALDVRYDIASDLNTMDLYIPESAGDHPVLVFIHGGGWTGGDKSRVPNAYGFADNGVLVASINYRLAPEFVHPAQAEDIARAIVWLQKNAEHYGGNPHELFLVGHSTGTHPAALVATDPQYLAAEGAKLSNIRGVILLDGRGYDIQHDVSIANPHDRQMYLSVFGETVDRWKDASPIYHIKSGTGIPPFLVFYGVGRYPGQEERKRADVEMLFQKLRQEGVDAEVIHTLQAHSSLESLFGAAGNGITKEILAFIARNQLK